jgi:protocatechuate 3,4-dioxygenase beta subunit
MPLFTRRSALAASGAALLAASPFAGFAAGLAATPAQSEGPFYPDRFPADTDADLVRIAGRARDASGEILILEGRVLDPEGRPAAGTLVEIWQTDANGRYIASGDRSGARPRDDDFQGYGAARTDGEGGFRFRTIRPVAYHGRAPHIHVKAHHPEGRVLTTQMYIAGDPANASDGLFRRLAPAGRERLAVPLTRAADGAEWRARFKIVLPWKIPGG